MRGHRFFTLAISGLAILAVAVLIFLKLGIRDRKSGDLDPHARITTPQPAPMPALLPGAQPLIGERILADYGNPARPPEDDLMWMARTLENFSMLVKGDNPLPLGANEEIAKALLGKNRAGLHALAAGHPALNAHGQLIDRWGTPLYFHARSRDKIDIRSAGPDRQMWTADDLHRQPNGRFLRGVALLPPSLFDESAEVR